MQAAVASPWYVDLRAVSNDDDGWTARCREAAGRHPEWEVDADALVAAVRSAWPDGPPLNLHLDDFTLAYACGRGQERAVVHLLREYGALMRREAAKVQSSPTFVADAEARLHERLLSPRDDKPPRIAGYHGRGALKDWVRVAAARNALNMARDDAADWRHRTSTTAEAVAIAPEQHFLEDRYREDVNDAIRFAFGSLEPQTRNILRMHYVDGLGLGELGALYGVHKSTMSRRIAKARDKVLHRTCERLSEQLSAPSADVASLIELLRSQIDITLSRVLPADP